MQQVPRPARDAAVGDLTDDALLLRELCHRTAVEAAGALAALRLAIGGGPPSSGRRLMEQAAGRLQGLGELNRLLGRSLPGRVDVGPAVHDVCVALGKGRQGAGASRMHLDLGAAPMEGGAARRLLLVAAELVGDAVRGALQDRAGRLRVALRADAGGVSLVVEDDGPGPRLLPAGEDDGDHRSVVLELVARAEGTMTLVTGRRGTRVTVWVPHGLEDEDEDLPF